MSESQQTDPSITMADSPGVKVGVDIEAPMSRVWELVTDVNLPGRFSDEFKGAEWLDPPGVGARFEGRNGIENLAEWTTTSTVTSWQPEAEFAWAVQNPEAPVSTWRFLISAEGSSTRLEFAMTLGPGESFLTQAISRKPERESAIIASRQAQHRANMERTIEGIKALAEA